MDTLIQYGLKNGSLINVRKVKSGLECGCICPACNHRLIAKKGRNLKHHFAHYEVADCEYGLNTTIRYIALEIIENNRKIVIPDNIFSCGKYRYNYPQGQILEIDKVTIEKSLLIPTPEITIFSSGKAIKLEIIVTHDIDKRTYYKFRKRRIPTLKLDLNSLKTTLSSRNPKSVLKKYLLEDSSHTSWLYNQEEEMIFSEFEDNVKSRNVVRIRKKDTVENCPLNEKDLVGYSTADFAKQCRKCDYLVDGILWDTKTDNPFILCCGEIRDSRFFREWEEFKI
ncbi:MAG: hypothetical protein GY863_13415 [bacterium]|nr:hypothetical protein [bacterium]